MAGLLDFIQGASNAAASNISGPVDLLGMGLRGIGVPVPQNAFMGSQWMRERGMMRDPQNRMAGLLGEAAGMSLPIAAAAKAPQIARGLLQAGDNLRAPNPMNTATRGQAGAVVFHGSPHKFDKFDSSKIGTGEGAQAYGHGLYFAESKNVAKYYRDTLSSPNVEKAADQLFNNLDDVFRKNLSHVPDTDARAVIHQLRLTPESLGAEATADDLMQFARAVADRSKSIGSGALYKVDLPDEHIAKMLDWDKPLSQQSAAAKTAIDGALNSGRFDAESVKAIKQFDSPGSVIYKLLSADNGGASQAAYRGSQQAADYLRTTGIPGLRYLDGGSRGAGAGTSNYVVFPGNEGLLNILSRE